jgi:hypothetical protein
MAGQPVTTERRHLKNLRARLLSFLEKQPDDKDKGRTQKKDRPRQQPAGRDRGVLCRPG